MIQAILTSADFCRALAALMFQTALMLTGIVILLAMFLGAKAAFKNFRLYHPHPIAKRIRLFLRNRRAKKAAA